MAKTAASLQIAAILLIQFYAIAPLFSRQFIAYAHVLRCTGDHAACGCSAERIASHTCCCCQSKRLGFMTPASGGCNSGSGEAEPVVHMTLVQGDAERSSPGCCNKNPGKAKRFGKEEHNRLPPCICCVPCGGDPAFISVSLEKLKFLRPAIGHFQPATFTAGYPFLPQAAYQGRIPEPPDPPPRLSNLS